MPQSFENKLIYIDIFTKKLNGNTKMRFYIIRLFLKYDKFYQKKMAHYRFSIWTKIIFTEKN